MRSAFALIAALFMMTPVALAQHDTHGEESAALTEDAAAHSGVAAAHGSANAPKTGVIPNGKEAIVMGIATIVVFGVVLLVLGTQVWPKISKGLDERAEKIRSEIASAEAARKQAKDALEQYEASLSEARVEAQKMLDDTKVQQTKLAAELRAKADAELTEMRERAMSDIDTAKRAALNEIYTHTAALATSVAGKILKREIADQDQSALLAESLAELQSN